MEQRWFILEGLGTPAALVEVGFLTNAREGALLATSAYQERLARAVADGLLQFLRGS